MSAPGLRPKLVQLAKKSIEPCSFKPLNFLPNFLKSSSQFRCFLLCTFKLLAKWIQGHLSFTLWIKCRRRKPTELGSLATIRLLCV